MHKHLLASVAALAVGVSAMTGHAVAIDPGDFNRILTEGFRTATVDGADVAGNAALPGNNDILSFSRSLDVGPFDPHAKVLLVGGVTAGGADEIFGARVSGIVDFSVLNFTATDPNVGGAFATDFYVLIDGEVAQEFRLSGTDDQLIENRAFSSLTLDNQKLGVRVFGRIANADYDVAFSISPLQSVGDEPGTGEPDLGPEASDSGAGNPPPIPLPPALPLLLAGLGAFGLAGQRRPRVQKL